MNLSHDIRMKTNRMALKWIFYSMLLIAGLCGYNSAGAQTVHPVTASLQLVPPYSVYLADYAAPGNDKLRVILTLNDLSQPSYTVRLRLKVELNGRVIMQTDPAYRPSGITIMPGMPQIITGTQLNEYLVSDHLQFLNGFSRDNYERTKALPEGAYRICVTAYDYNRSDDVAISNDGCNIFFFQKNEAPLLNYPLCNSRVDRKDPQFLTFTWSIRNTPSFVTGSSGTGYRFELFEVRPAGSNAEYIVRSSTPIYSVTTDNAMLVYGPGEPRLQDSMQYVWRVQAFDKSGRDAYQNNGYSQACMFTYGGVNPFVTNNIGKAELLAEALGERSGKWWWHIGSSKPIDGWNIQYRKQAATTSKTETYDWNSKYLTDTLFHLFNLEPDNTYEAKVQPVISGINGFWSETVVFRTMPKRVYECGKNDTTNNGLGANAAGQPLNSAIAGMVVRVGDFDMQLLEVSGGNGRFSGYGAIATPLLGMRLNVKFADVQINDKLLLTQGEVVALTDGIDAWIKDRTKVSNDVETIKSWAETMPNFETGSLGEIKDFAKELLGISDGIWNDTYVYTEQERKDVQTALAEVKAAMQDLEDSDPSNDAAAEKKLRQTLKKVEPLLEKLSNNIGKGVLVKLGFVKNKLITDGLTDIKKQVEAKLQKLVFEDNEARRSLLAIHGPHVFGYKGRDNDKDNLEAKKKLIEKLLADEQSRQLFAGRIEKNNEDNSYLNEQENTLKPLLEKEENKSKNCNELLKADSWTKVTTLIDKYLDIQLKAEQLLQGSRFISEDSKLSGLSLPENKIYYLTPGGQPLNLEDFPGVIKIASYNEATNLYVIVGFDMALSGKRQTWNAKADNDGKFVGYVNTNDPTDILDISSYLANASTCRVLLPYSIDGCNYKILVLDKWEVPKDQTIEEVQTLLIKAAAPLKTIDKGSARALVSMTIDGVSIPACKIGNDAFTGMAGITGNTPELIVMASSIPDQQALRLKLSSIGFKTDQGGGYYFDRILVTDENITAEQAQALKSMVDKSTLEQKNYRILWIKLDKTGKFKGVETHYSSDVSQEARIILDAFRDYIDYVGKRDDWKKFVDHISDALKQLADFIRKIKVPEKYYNPLHKDYDKESFVLFLFKQASVASAYTTGLGPILQTAPGINGKLSENIGIPEVDFAFYCGVWNGLVEQIAALPEGASWLIDLVTDKDHARDQFIAGMQKMHKEAEHAGGFCKLLGQIIGTNFNGPNAALNAHSYGVGTSQVLTFFLAVAKVGQATKVVNLLNKLDAVGGLVNLTLSPIIKSLGWATKLVLKGTGRVAVRIVKDGADVAAAFFKAGSFGYGNKLYSVWIPFLPNLEAAAKELIKKLKRIKQVVKDGNGNFVKDENGRYVIELEYVDADGKTGTMHAAVDDLNKFLKSVEPDMRAADELDGFIVEGKYLDNPTKTHVEDLEINPSGTVKSKTQLNPDAGSTELMNGQFMYVVDENGKLIMGSRAKWSTDAPFNQGRAPHPTLIGGLDPKVQAAGIVEFRGGKIYKVDNSSGHFKPSTETLEIAEQVFKENFEQKSFSSDFKGFLPYGN